MCDLFRVKNCISVLCAIMNGIRIGFFPPGVWGEGCHLFAKDVQPETDHPSDTADGIE